MAPNWYSLHVKPHKERVVHEQLQLQHEIDSFLPLLHVKPKNPRAAKQRPYFPGYLFVQADLEVIGANTINWTPGTHGLVSFGGEPAVVPQNLIHELQQQIAEIKRQGGLGAARFATGERVRFVDGVFEGYEAIFDHQVSGSERVQVLLAFLSNHPQPILTDVANIEKINR